MRIKYCGFTAEISEKSHKLLCERSEKYYTKQVMKAMGWKEGEYYSK